ncbi:MAG TPA: DUF4199 domain-containing protein [Ohtaekwangia sp.]|nr:DUF4199 domain-containing protein [Ohtaekwangia sp.]
MESTSINNPHDGLIKDSLRSGAIIGVIGVAVMAISYVVDESLLANWKILVVMLVMYIGLVIYLGIRYRNQAGGFMSYGQAFLHGFVMLATAGLIGVLFNGILYSLIDPGLGQRLAEITIEKTSEMMRGFGASENDIDQAIAKMEEDMPKQFSFVGQLKGYLWGLIMYAIISLISALFVRKTAPEVL